MRKRGPARVAFQLKGATTGVAVTLGAGGGGAEQRDESPHRSDGQKAQKDAE